MVPSCSPWVISSSITEALTLVPETIHRSLAPRSLHTSRSYRYSYGAALAPGTQKGYIWAGRITSSRVQSPILAPPGRLISPS